MSDTPVRKIVGWVPMSRQLYLDAHPEDMTNEELAEAEASRQRWEREERLLRNRARCFFGAIRYRAVTAFNVLIGKHQCDEGEDW